MALPRPLIHQLQTMWEDFNALIPYLVMALVVLVLTGIVVAIAGRGVEAILARRVEMRPSLRNFVVSLTRFGVWLLGGLLALAIVFPSITPAKLLTALGLGTIAVGLAFQDIFENFLAGIMIMLRRPMRVGDYIRCEEVNGMIEDITIRDTYIRQTDNQLAVIPNSMVYKNPVYILTNKPLRRWEALVGIGYEADLDRACETIKKALQKLDFISTEQPVSVMVTELAASTVNLRIWWWAAPAPRDETLSKDKVLRAVKQACDEEGINLPFPQRTIGFRDRLVIQGPEELEAKPSKK